jgi:hypothetical protein
LLGLFFDPEDEGSSGTSVDFNRLHGIMFQKRELFIITVVRTSNPTFYT